MSKAIGLFSGGLDSVLACKLMMDMGVEVKGLSFIMSFAAKDTEGFKAKIKERAKAINLDLELIDISDVFLDLLENPSYGFGKHMNPCIDCKILMLTKAKKIMQEKGYDFIFTGEVLGERPMSQRRPALNSIEKRSGLRGYLLRPLSAKLLNETIAEKEGLIDREQLLSFSGRSRKPQMALADKYGIHEYAAPAGGCLLTDPQFAKRLIDITDNEGITIENVDLLKCGRHFRLDDKTKLVIGRDHNDNENIIKLKNKEDNLLKADDFAGPIGLLRGEQTDQNIKLSAGILVSYTKRKDEKNLPVLYWTKEDKKNQIIIDPIKKEELKKIIL